MLNLIYRQSILIILFATSVFCFQASAQHADANKGIDFRNYSRWDEVVEKAKKEQKYIFVDCYTTWCLPCKFMDKEIYPLEVVGNFMNTNFISIKIQLDRPTKEHNESQDWYVNPDSFSTKFSIGVYPTYLFFSPNGEVVHKATGRKSAEQFMWAAKNALDEYSQLYTLLKRSREGNLSLVIQKKMAREMKKMNDKKLAEELAERYLVMNNYQVSEGDDLRFLMDFREISAAKRTAKNYISQLSNEGWKNQDAIRIISAFLDSSTTKGFNIFLSNMGMVDQIMETRGYAQDIIDYVIYMEQVLPNLTPESKPITNPDWKKIKSGINHRYGNVFARRITNTAKISWCSNNQEWECAANYLIKKIESDNLGNEKLRLLRINNWTWDIIFLNCTNQRLIKKGAKIMKDIIENNPEELPCIDTYANLLYKLGEKNRAIEMEQRAVKIAKEKKEDAYFQDFSTTLEKMKLGVPTWNTHSKPL